MKNFLGRFIDYNARELKKLQAIADKVNALEDEIKKLSDEQLRQKTEYFRDKLSNGASLDDILPEAFAVVRETSVRVLGMRPFDVQILGAIALHQGRVAEMKTGEGKTLAATMPAYLNALSGKGVHIVTVNDYLAERDSEWMGQIYQFLGLEVGLIKSGMKPPERKISYQADIIYGTNNEFGFDYLRDNMALRIENIVQRDLNFAIIDEVDSILIDEARTPLIISGPDEMSSAEYHRFTQISNRLKKEEDYTVDEKARSVALTENGIQRVESSLSIENLYDPENIEYSHRINNALKAKELMKRDKDYIVKDDEVIIVDDFTGRLMYGRRYSDGLHQAIEAKEGVTVAKESKTYATITLQNYFRLYNKLSGMTGTAKTEEDELSAIYGMDVVEIPTNKPLIRDDMPDQIYKDIETKYKAVIESIIEKNKKGQPVLVGTVSIEVSELLSTMLKKKGIKHNVLNAKYHEQEADIVKDAGQFKMVTIATNMAGRGTDIVLGEGVKEVGGLHVLGTERHESRRIDNQLRGRSGRQGDPGSSQFFVSLEDDLMRLFATDLASGLIDKLGLDETEALEHSMLDRSIERAQKRVEENNYSIRKHILEYDNVMNKQREVIYAERKKILNSEDVKDNILAMINDVTKELVNAFSEKFERDVEGLYNQLQILVPQLEMNYSDWEEYQAEELIELISSEIKDLYSQREEEFGNQLARDIERIVLLRVVDRKWMDHIDAMTKLRQGIGLRAYGGRNPVQEYQNEAFNEFQNLIYGIKEDTVKNMFHVQIQKNEKTNLQPKQNRQLVTNSGNQAKPKTVVNKEKVGRNDPCPCGSGKKYKKCCGR
ncbi:MAG: preprotein translocase subunit SecA [Clostridia bacterium]